MSKNLQLHIPAPCHENWNDMSPDQQGRFCLSCQKSVVDFTSMTDQEIIRYFQNVKGSTCGRFSDDQLNRNYEIDSKKRLNWFKYFLQILLPALLVTSKSNAQVYLKKKVTTNVSSDKCVREFRSLGFTLARIVDTVITGEVIDKHNRPIPKATVMIKGTGKGVVADKNGKFKLSATQPLPLTLSISSTGFHPVEMVVDENKIVSPVCARLPEYPLVGIMGAIVIGRATPKMEPKILHQFNKIVKDSLKAMPFSFTSSSLKLYPNPLPLSSFLNIEYSNKLSGKYSIEIFDMNGKLLKVEEFDSSSPYLQKQIKLPNEIVPGTYLVQLIGPDGRRVSSKKLIISK